MKKTRILIIDDDIPLTQSMKINLEDTGCYDVCMENSSLQAIATAQVFLPDLIILDVVMPDMDGGDVSSLLKAEPELCDVPILMVTALVSNAETGLDAGVSSGGQVIVAKPIRFEKLVEAIESLLAKLPC
jgi:DNA-binding response OmpR family regulator